jgi:hypothetical protein
MLLKYFSLLLSDKTFQNVRKQSHNTPKKNRDLADTKKIATSDVYDHLNCSFAMKRWGYELVGYVETKIETSKNKLPNHGDLYLDCMKFLSMKTSIGERSFIPTAEI